MEGNIRCAIWLQVMYYGESVRRLRKAWSRLPPEFRAQVLEHFERLDKDSGEEWCWRAIKELNLCPEMFRDPRK
jgi:hypothetical protein